MLPEEISDEIPKEKLQKSKFSGVKSKPELSRLQKLKPIER
jgi:hypothetical protein